MDSFCPSSWLTILINQFEFLTSIFFKCMNFLIGRLYIGAFFLASARFKIEEYWGCRKKILKMLISEFVLIFEFGKMCKKKRERWSGRKRQWERGEKGRKRGVGRERTETPNNPFYLGGHLRDFCAHIRIWNRSVTLRHVDNDVISLRQFETILMTVDGNR